MYEPQVSEEELLKFRQDMFRDLRGELAHLKTCQNNSITFGIAGASVMLGLVKSGVMETYIPFFFLLPLVILLPFWLIFFEKVRTISRMTGFIRVQEKLALAKEMRGIIGWESAIQQYWLRKSDWNNQQSKDAIRDVNTNFNSNRGKSLVQSMYWFTVYCVFYILSFLCIILGYFSISQEFGWFIIVESIMLLIFLSVFTYYSIQWESMINDIFKFIRFCIFIGICNVFCLLVSFYFLSSIHNSMDISNDFSDFWLPAIDHSFHILGAFLIFSVSLAIFFVFSMSTLWFFYSLVKGRYTYDAFEYRWWIILDLDIKGFKEKRVTTSSPPEIPTQTPT